MEIKKIKELHELGIVPEAKMRMVKIIIRFKELSKNHSVKGDIYFQLSEEFYLSESQIKGIVSQNRHLL